MLSRPHFRQHAQAIAFSLAGVPLAAVPKEMSTGSLGWHANQRISIDLGGEPVQVQVNVLLTIAHSKELPR